MRGGGYKCRVFKMHLKLRGWQLKTITYIYRLLHKNLMVTTNQKSQRHNPLRLQKILQSYSNQNSVVLAQKQTYASMQQNREPRNKPTHLWSINL